MTTKQYGVPVVPSYFSNISSIEKLAILHDAPEDTTQAELALYFNDLYQVFLHRFSQFAYSDTVSKEDETQMLAMLAELIKIKHSLQDAAEA
jgi:hypothetical protein